MADAGGVRGWEDAEEVGEGPGAGEGEGVGGVEGGECFGVAGWGVSEGGVGSGGRGRVLTFVGRFGGAG